MSLRFLISNTVPLNGGDEALLRAIVESLDTRYPRSEITILCSRVDECRQQLPDLQLAPDLEYATTSAERRLVSELYRQADIVLSAPGGFLHDFYSIEDRLRGFEVALSLGKPVVLLPQSIGPFWKSDSRTRIPEVLNRVAAICVRDDASVKHLHACGVNPARIYSTADAAFLWRRIAPELFQPRTGGTQRIGLCFREWPLGNTSGTTETVAKAELLCRHLLADESRDLLFLSTCQGIPGYVDDSILAEAIVQRLPPELRVRCTVDRQRYAPRELIGKLAECDAFIGMRLHGCILAMLGGTPAMGLGYEQKTAEIFGQLSLETYQTSFEGGSAEWLRCADYFLERVDEIARQLRPALDKLCTRAAVSLDIVDSHILPAVRSNVTAQPKSEWVDLIAKYGVPHLRLRQVAALVRDLDPRQIVDLGCGTGHLHHLCPDIDYVGCDFVAPTGPVDFPFYQCDFNHELLAADLQELELVTCSGILEYISDLSTFLATIRSRLRDGGHLVATYFNMNHISRIASLLRGRSFPVRPDWRGFFSPREIASLIENTGFRITKTVAMNHSLKSAAAVGDTTSALLALPHARAWSPLLSHQFLFVATCAPVPGRPAPTSELLATIPPGRSFILVDDDQWAHHGLGDRRPIPFLEKDGQYWGPPAGDAEGIQELERLRQQGAGYIAFASPAFWWLEYYGGLRRHLETTARRVLVNEHVIVFDLSRSAAAGGAEGSAEAIVRASAKDSHRG